MKFEIQIEVEYVPIETVAQLLAWREAVRCLWGMMSDSGSTLPASRFCLRQDERDAVGAISDGMPCQRSEPSFR